MIQYENKILRPAVLRALSTQTDVAVHVVPVEVLSQARRRRSASELGKGTPDLLCSLAWQRNGVKLAQMIGIELKRPALPAGPSCTACCLPCSRGARGLSVCCAARVIVLPQAMRAGELDPAQNAVHAAWASVGRWVWVASRPDEVLRRLDIARSWLRVAGAAAPFGPGLVTGREDCCICPRGK